MGSSSPLQTRVGIGSLIEKRLVLDSKCIKIQEVKAEGGRDESRECR